MREQLFNHFFDLLKQKTNINIDKSSIIAKLVIYPIAVLYEEIFSMINDFNSLINNRDFVNLLYTKLYGIENVIIDPIPGVIKININEIEEIKIQNGTRILSLNSDRSGVVIEDLFLTKEEVQNRIINNMDIVIHFVGNLILNEEVVFDNYSGSITSAIVIQEYNNNVLHFDNSDLINILVNKPILHETYSIMGILKLISDIDPEAKVVDTLSSDNPFVVFDMQNSKRITSFRPCYIDDDNKLYIL